MFVDTIAVAIDGAPSLARLNELSSAIWKGLAAGALGDDDAQRLAEVIHARKIALRGPEKTLDSRPALFPARRVQRPPRRPEAIQRRRRLAASGPLPPALASRFTTGELAVLRIVGDECRDRGTCSLSLAEIAARAGCCRDLVKRAIRLAARLGLLTVEIRRRPGQKNLPNVVRVVDREWSAWLARGPRPDQRLAEPRDRGDKNRPHGYQRRFREKERAGRGAHNRKGGRGGKGAEGSKAMR